MVGIWETVEGSDDCAVAVAVDFDADDVIVVTCGRGSSLATIEPAAADQWCRSA